MSMSSALLISVMLMIVSSIFILLDIYRKLRYTAIRNMQAFLCLPILVMAALTLACMAELFSRHVRFVW